MSLMSLPRGPGDSRRLHNSSLLKCCLLCMCSCLHASTYVCKCTFVYMWRPEQRSALNVVLQDIFCLIFVCLFVWGCILLLLLSLETGFLWTRSSPVRLDLLASVPSCLYPSCPKIAGKCLTASFFMSVLEIKLWPRAYMVSTILMKPYLQTPACFCFRSRVTVLSDSLIDNCKYAPPYNGMTRHLCFHFLFPFNEFFLVRQILSDWWIYVGLSTSQNASWNTWHICIKICFHFLCIRN